MTASVRARPAAIEPAAKPVRWSQRLEAAGTSVWFGLMRLLPLDAASAFGGWLGRTIGPRLGISKRARQNLAKTMPELSRLEIERIVRGMWDNLGRVVAEYPHLRDIRVFAPNRRVAPQGVEHVDQALAAGRTIIFFSAHIANWEIGPLAAVEYGLSTALVYRPANNPLVDRIIERCRGAHRMLIPKGGRAGREALTALRRGTHLLMLVDQKMNDGIPVPFFGRPAMTAPGLAALALRSNCAVLPTRVERVGGAHFRLTVEAPLPLPESGDRDGDAAALMAAVNQTVERWVRARPEQWFWLHRRWPD